MKPSIKQISERTGFSLATVSNVLNNKGVFSVQTRDTILKAAKEIGYISKKNSKRIKLVVYKYIEEISEYLSFFSLLFTTITNECSELGYKLEIQNLYRNSQDFNVQLETVLKENAAGIIFLATELEDSILELVKESTVPVVILDNHPRTTKYASVSINNIGAAYSAVKHLIDNDHKRIGYLKSKMAFNNIRQREIGYLQALSDFGIPHNEGYDISLPLNMEDAYNEMKDYLSKNKNLPTAYFASNDIIAISAMKALTESGYKIPDDISIIGFDDIPFSSMITPSLSTVHVYEEELGKAAVEVLVKIVSGEPCITSHILINTSLVIRESVKKLNK